MFAVMIEYAACMILFYNSLWLTVIVPVVGFVVLTASRRLNLFSHFLDCLRFGSDLVLLFVILHFLELRYYLLRY